MFLYKINPQVFWHVLAYSCLGTIHQEIRLFKHPLHIIIIIIILIIIIIIIIIVVFVHV